MSNSEIRFIWRWNKLNYYSVYCEKLAVWIYRRNQHTCSILYSTLLLLFLYSAVLYCSPSWKSSISSGTASSGCAEHSRSWSFHNFPDPDLILNSSASRDMWSTISTQCFLRLAMDLLATLTTWAWRFLSSTMDRAWVLLHSSKAFCFFGGKLHFPCSSLSSLCFSHALDSVCQRITALSMGLRNQAGRCMGGSSWCSRSWIAHVQNFSPPNFVDSARLKSASSSLVSTCGISSTSHSFLIHHGLKTMRWWQHQHRSQSTTRPPVPWLHSLW